MNNPVNPKRTPVVDQIFGDNKAPIETVLRADFAHLDKGVTAMATEGLALPKKIATDDQQIAAGQFITRARAFAKVIDEIRTTEGRPLLDNKRELDAYFNGLSETLALGVSQNQRAADDYVRAKAAEARAKADREAQIAREKADAERAKAETAKTSWAAGRADARADAHDAKADQAAAVAASSAADLNRMRGGGVTSSAKENWKLSIEDYIAAVTPLGAIGPYFKREAVEAALTSMLRIQKDAAAWPGVRFYKDTKATFR